ncbi:MAG TPA: ferrous iron transport protein A [Clostridia bacterium]|jgi:Fe2+ transport system protein FeoA|nr:ferrous iron transport protein A [Clostridia bacterium]
MEKKLSEFQVGQSGRVKFVRGESKLKRRLFDMGVTSGADVKLVRVAPLGDPIEVTIRGYQLSLRKAEAEIVIMEEDKK